MAGQSASILVRILGDSKNVKGVLDDTESRFSRFGKGVAKVGLVVGAGLAAGGVAAVAFGKTAVAAASDVEESMSKVETIFGDAAGPVIDFSETTATALGLSQAEALAALGTFGNLFNALGLAPKPAADMSQSLVTLSADLASFNNLAGTDVLEKLRAGLAGEAEPLRALGVFLNAASVEAKAMELGLVGANEEVSEAAKVQARYALILEQTETAQGDFARTSDGLANSQRILSAGFEDIQAKIGTALLPVMTAAVGFITAEMLPAVEDLFEFFQAEAVPAIEDLAAELRDRLVPVIEDVVDWFQDDFLPAAQDLAIFLRDQVIPPVIDFAEAATELGVTVGGVAGDVGQRLLPVARELANLFLERILPAVTALTQFFADNRGAVIGLAVVVGTLFAVQQAHAAFLAVQAVGGLAAYIAQIGIVQAVTATWTALQWLLNVALSANPIGLVVVAIAGLVAAIVVAWKHSETFRRIVTAAFDAVRDVAEAVFKWVRRNWPLLLAILTGPIGAAVLIISRNWDTIRDGFTAVRNWIGARVSEIVGIITGIPGRIAGTVSTMWQPIQAGITAAKDWVAARINEIVGFVAGLPGRISSAASGMWDGVASAFRSAVDAMRGIWNAFANVWNGIQLSVPGVDIPLVGTVGGFTVGLPNVPRLAQGGFALPNSLALVGERGPELLAIGRQGATVFDNDATMTALGRGNTITINMYDSRASAADVSHELRWLTLTGQL